MHRVISQAYLTISLSALDNEASSQRDFVIGPGMEYTLCATSWMMKTQHLCACPVMHNSLPWFPAAYLKTTFLPVTFFFLCFPCKGQGVLLAVKMYL